jgi:hypothetical protein
MNDPGDLWFLPYVEEAELLADPRQNILTEITSDIGTPLVVPNSTDKNWLEYAAPFEGTPSRLVPPLWLSAIGNHYAYPIATLPSPSVAPPAGADEAAQQTPSLDTLRQEAREILPWRSLAVIFALDSAVLGVAMLVLLAKRYTAEKSPKWPSLPLVSLKWFGDYPPPPPKILAVRLLRDGSLARRKVWLFYFACFLCPLPLFFSTVVGAVLQDLPASTHSWWTKDPWAMVLCCYCGFSSAVCFLTACARGRKLESFRAGLGGIASLIVFVVAGIAPFFATLGDVEGSSHYHLFLALRAVRLFSNVSFLAPVIFALAGAVVLASSGLLVSCTVIERPLLSDYPGMDKLVSFKKIFSLRSGFIGELLNPLLDLRGRLTPGQLVSFVMAIIFCTCLFLRGHLITVDGRLFDYIVLAIILGFYAAVAMTLHRMLVLWSILRALLRRLYRHPTRVYYTKFNSLILGEDGRGINLFSVSPTTNFLSIALERAKNLERLAFNHSHKPGEHCLHFKLFGRLKIAYLALTSSPSAVSVSAHDPATALNWEDWTGAIEETWQSESEMAECAVQLLAPIETWWGIDFKKDAVSDCERDAGAIMDDAGILLAAGVAGFVRNALPHLQCLALASTLTSLLLLFAISSYSLFFNLNDLLMAGWIVVLLSVVTTTWVYFSLNRNRVLSMISGTTPGEVTWSTHFVGQLALHAILPLLAILGTSFPAGIDQLLASIPSLVGKG